MCPSDSVDPLQECMLQHIMRVMCLVESVCLSAELHRQCMNYLEAKLQYAKLRDMTVREIQNVLLSRELAHSCFSFIDSDLLSSSALSYM